MPRDGSGIYTLPYPAVVDGTTIESAVHNGTMSDFALQLNGPVPIVAGGTGANNAASALANLGAEKSMQQVTNYDTHVFVAGSFFSSAGTTSEPVASHNFMGTAVLTSANQIILEARDQTDNEQLWTRRKNTTWGAWVKQAGRPADLDAAYVNISGDTMSGLLKVNYASPVIQLDKTASGQIAYVAGMLNNAMRWIVRLGDSTAESTGNAGSNFGVSRYDDAGAVIDTPFSIIRSTGNASFTANLAVGVALSVTDTLTAAGENHTFGSGGTSTLKGQLLLNGGSAAGGGANIAFRRNSANSWSFGHQTVTSGGSTDDLQLYNWTAAAYAIRVTAAASNVSLGSTTASTSPTTGALIVGGGLGVAGAAFLGANLTLRPPASATPAVNGEMTFQLTSNTSLVIKVKGSDGTVRVATLTLA